MRAFRVGVAGLLVINKVDLDAHATHPHGSHEHHHAHDGIHH
jgi:hypothetical protein